MKPVFKVAFYFIIVTCSCKEESTPNPLNEPKESEIIFNPNLTYGTFTDQDDNVYKTITIGTLGWMTENLRTTKYRDGVTIQNVTDNNQWLRLI